MAAFKKAGSKTTAKKDYPVLPDTNQELSQIVDSILPLYEELEALMGDIKLQEGELKSKARSYYFEHFEGRTDVPSSVRIQGTVNDVLISFMKRDKAVDADDEEKIELLKRITGAHFDEMFEEKMVFTIDTSQMNRSLINDFNKELLSLCGMFDVFDAVSLKHTLTTLKSFHTERFHKLTRAENEAINKLIPITVACKKKGIKR